ncbi:MAG: hypothetical protein ACXVPU_13590 [Bacteroidia bacterium]
MKKNIFLFLVLLSVLIFSSFVISKGKTTCLVKYNGIYACKLDKENSAIIRFYEDGTVLASTSVNDYMDVFTWFHKDNKDMVLTGTYKIKNCSIKFEVSGMTGKQSYNGSVEDNSISVKLTDEASKKTATRTYAFFAL